MKPPAVTKSGACAVPMPHSIAKVKANAVSLLMIEFISWSPRRAGDGAPDHPEFATPHIGARLTRRRRDTVDARPPIARGNHRSGPQGRIRGGTRSDAIDQTQMIWNFGGSPA